MAGPAWRDFDDVIVVEVMGEAYRLPDEFASTAYANLDQAFEGGGGQK